VCVCVCFGVCVCACVCECVCTCVQCSGQNIMEHSSPHLSLSLPFCEVPGSKPSGRHSSHSDVGQSTHLKSSPPASCAVRQHLHRVCVYVCVKCTCVCAYDCVCVIVCVWSGQASVYIIPVCDMSHSYA